eukprot:TRINITY_DN5613_c0_g2_i1.p1 TRINITY_DN5613_c0_g2~~TRINITY_DN5613_c0_g2_i1.p1  ORF type:complete len:324 (-),score=59.19 TRINITY_DN5613_c0_g2_i1:106-1077(-)
MEASTSAIRELYPEVEPYATGTLRVSGPHTLYYEQVGNPSGKPVVVLHGGPGGGVEPYYRRFFDPEVYRVVLLDQRGAGKSTPHANLEKNTTWDLVADIELLREHLGIDKWVVFGGSWGATLSLAYSETHPTRVKALILRGVFALRRSELLFFYQEGASWMFPDAWEHYLAPIPEPERGDLMSAYHRRLTGDDEEVKRKCAIAWSVWEMATSRLYVDPDYIARAADDVEFALAFARIECHYFVNAGFFKKDGQLIEDAHKLSEIPGVIVQGRYDMVCPMKTAWDLHKNWSKAELKIIPDAGHSMKEPGIQTALLNACDKFRDL